MTRNVLNSTSLAPLLIVAALLSSLALPTVSMAQDDLAVVRGKVGFDRGEKRKVPLTELDVKLRQQVQLPAVPLPKDFADRTSEEQQKWIEAYEKSDAGKKFIEQRTKLLEDAAVFDVILERDGSFIVYDVPPGIYGIQGRLDKEIKGTKHAFEVFGEISISKKVDDVPLAPIMVEITPLLETGQAAPPINVPTYNNKGKLNLDTFNGKYLFVNFWSTLSPDIEIQRQVQKMYVDLKGKHNLKLLSVCIDEKRKAAVKFIVEKKIKEGSHGFTDGWQHATVDGYGVRSLPSFWLINPDREIIMTQYDFGQAFAAGKSNLAEIVSDRIEGKDLPTPAETKPAEK